MGRFVHLSRAKISEGRALLFAKALHEVSTLTGGEALRYTTELFDTRKYDLRTPLVVTLKDGVDLAAFEQACEEHGISMLVEGE